MIFKTEILQHWILSIILIFPYCSSFLSFKIHIQLIIGLIQNTVTCTEHVAA